MPRPIHVAQVVGRMKSGGVESTVLNHFFHTDPKRVHFTFVAQEDSTSIPYDAITNHGGNVLLVPSYKNLPQYIRACTRIFQEIKLDIVHSHMNALSIFPLKAAKSAGISIRIAHSHSTADPNEHMKTLAKDMLKPFSRIYPTNYAACSDHAARWLFGNKLVEEHKVFILRNAIDIPKFIFNPDIRKIKRKELGVQDDQVLLGQVGRISHQKNQLFTLRVFAQLLQSMPNAVLTIVGDNDGVDLHQEIQRLGIGNKVKLLGIRNDVAQLYSAFDVLMFPSTYEGLGIKWCDDWPVIRLMFPSTYEGLGMASIESQTADLPVICSTDVPREADIIPELVYRVSLKDPIGTQWVPTIQNVLAQHPVSQRTDQSIQMQAAGYDIQQGAEQLTKWYEALLRK